MVTGAIVKSHFNSLKIPIIALSIILLFSCKSTDVTVAPWVIVSFTVTEKGHTTNIVVLEASPGAGEAIKAKALDAASQFVYKPRVVNGKAVTQTDVTARISIEIE